MGLGTAPRAQLRPATARLALSQWGERDLRRLPRSASESRSRALEMILGSCLDSDGAARAAMEVGCTGCKRIRPLSHAHSAQVGESTLMIKCVLKMIEGDAEALAPARMALRHRTMRR